MEFYTNIHDEHKEYKKLLKKEFQKYLEKSNRQNEKETITELWQKKQSNNFKQKILLYNALSRSNFAYGITAWGNNNYNKIIPLQKWAILHIHGAPSRVHSGNLYINNSGCRT